jgi:hypothetical protein
MAGYPRVQFLPTDAAPSHPAAAGRGSLGDVGATAIEGVIHRFAARFRGRAQLYENAKTRGGAQIGM